MDITLKSIIGFLDSKEKIRIVKKGEVVYSGLVKDLLKNESKKVLDAVESKIISMYINECLAVNVESRMMKYYKISEEDLTKLIENAKFLDALESYGLDNWDGYDMVEEHEYEVSEEDYEEYGATEIDDK